MARNSKIPKALGIGVDPLFAQLQCIKTQYDLDKITRIMYLDLPCNCHCKMYITHYIAS